jgi:hypothetical protein
MSLTEKGGEIPLGPLRVYLERRDQMDECKRSAADDAVTALAAGDTAAVAALLRERKEP